MYEKHNHRQIRIIIFHKLPNISQLFFKTTRKLSPTTQTNPHASSKISSYIACISYIPLLYISKRKPSNMKKKNITKKEKKKKDNLTQSNKNLSLRTRIWIIPLNSPTMQYWALLLQPARLENYKEPKIVCKAYFFMLASFCYPFSPSALSSCPFAIAAA